MFLQRIDDKVQTVHVAHPDTLSLAYRLRGSGGPQFAVDVNGAVARKIGGGFAYVSDHLLATVAVTIVWIGFIGSLVELARAVWWVLSG